MSLVVDSSIAIAWCAESQTSPLSEAAESDAVAGGAIAPAHFQLEVVHALHRLVRARRLAITRMDVFLDALPGLGIKYDLGAVEDVHVKVLPLARRHSLGLYDAAYLELALRLQLPLATRDRQLAAAAMAAGAILFTP